MGVEFEQDDCTKPLLKVYYPEETEEAAEEAVKQPEVATDAPEDEEVVVDEAVVVAE